jgi:hypothetical protein
MDVVIKKEIGNYPEGWFLEGDIEIYRELVSSLSNNAVMAEIGTWKGRSLCSIAHILIEKKIKVFAVDNFCGSATDVNIQWHALNHDIRGLLETGLRKFKIYNNVVIMAEASESAAKNIQDESLDFVFIDAEHDHKSVKSDIECWLPKIKDNGIIAGHDWNLQSVQKAVHEKFRSKEVKNYKDKASLIWSYTKKEVKNGRNNNI